ncbi:hypothetical protein BH24ACT23_BH24ACT23_06990 [soil metagenome]
MTAAVVLAALAGGLGAVAFREILRATPALAKWLRGAFEPLRRAGSEGYSPDASERRTLGLIAAGALLGVGAWFLGPGPAVPAAAAGPATASWAIASRAGRYRRAVERALPSLAIATADALAAGRSVRAALDASSASLEGAAAAELARVRADLDVGLALDEALQNLRGRIRSPRVDAFCLALLSQRIAGGDLVALLRRYSEAAAARERAAADARSATAQARFTGYLVAAMPAGGALLAELLAPGFIGGLLANPASISLIGAAVALQAAGFAAIRRLSRIGPSG